MQMFAVRCCELEVNSNPIESFFNYECRVPSIGVFFVASFSTDYIAAIVAGLPVLSFLLFFFYIDLFGCHRLINDEYFISRSFNQNREILNHLCRFDISLMNDDVEYF